MENYYKMESGYIIEEELLKPLFQPMKISTSKEVVLSIPNNSDMYILNELGEKYLIEKIEELFPKFSENTEIVNGFNGDVCVFYVESWLSDNRIEKMLEPVLIELLKNKYHFDD